MSRTRVVILTSRSMFSEGIAARLGQFLDRIDLLVVDSRDPGYPATIHQAQPAVVVLEANDENVDRLCPLDKILAAAPEVRVIRLDRDLDQIHVVTGELRTVNEPADFIDMLLLPRSHASAELQ